MGEAGEGMRLDGRRVIVAGASAGIGRSFAIRARRAGAEVVVGARRTDVLDEVVAEAGGGTAVALDVTDEASCAAFLAGALAELGGIDLMLCTVGYAELRPLADVDEGTWARTMATNLVGLNRLITGALPALSPAGVVAVLSSETAAAPRHGLVPYAASKAALEATLKGIRVEHPGTRVSCVVVGATFPTEFGASFDRELLGPAMASWRRHGLMQQQFMEPDEVARCLVDVLGAALRCPGVCIEEVVLRSPSPVIGAPGPA
ncbi:MAG TPA: SDR family oxidoreductase [Acidimicrobiales bacterium]